MIALDATARALMDTAPYQRLRRVRQLGMAHLVYPSAVHTRFEHGLGAHHLCSIILDQLRRQGDLEGIDPAEATIARYAALLHDLAHYPGAHLLEEFGYPGVCHETAAERWLANEEVAEALAGSGLPDAADRIGRLIRGESDSPLQGLVSGPCDADKLDYLTRDAFHCGMSSVFDLEYLRNNLTMVAAPGSGRRELGLHERALPAFEQLLYGKGVLYRTVYFHGTVRAAMAMLRAVLVAALEAGILSLDELLEQTDDELMTLLRLRVGGTGNGAASRHVGELIERLARRHLFKSAASLPLGDVEPMTPAQVADAERRIAADIGFAAGEVLLDIPSKPKMFDADILVQCEDGGVVDARRVPPESGFAFNVVRDSLYEASGRVRVFTARATVVPASGVLAAVSAART